MLSLKTKRVVTFKKVKYSRNEAGVLIFFRAGLVTAATSTTKCMIRYIDARLLMPTI